MSRLVGMLPMVGVALVLCGCVVDTDPATHIRATQAQLNAHGHTTDAPAEWWWEYSTSQSTLKVGNGTKVCGNPPEPDRRCGPAQSANDVKLSQVVTGLTPNTTYYFRACGQDTGWQRPACGNIRSFTTTKGDSKAEVATDSQGRRVLRFTAASGTQNWVTLFYGIVSGSPIQFGYNLSDVDSGGTPRSSVVAGPGCRNSTGDATYDAGVTCSASIDYIEIFTGDLDDRANMKTEDPQPVGAVLHGGPGDDRLTGTDNNDIIIGDSGYDGLYGEGGNDILGARDGEPDFSIWCGAGTDTAYLDSESLDLGLSVDACESVQRP
jgi:Ca2+-binding RTX toxin-like protein